MKSKLGGLLIVGVVVLLLLGYWKLAWNQSDSTEQASDRVQGRSPQLETSKSKVEQVPSEKKELDSEFDELAEYGETADGVFGDLGLVQNLIETYQIYSKYEDALPTAGNKELVDALRGNNRYGQRFISSNFKFINSNGEIVDRWDSPLIFHFETAECPDIRSKGPDKLAWTEDDVVLKY